MTVDDVAYTETDESKRALDVQRAMRACAEAPRKEWPGLVERMAKPGYGLVLGRMLRTMDTLSEQQPAAGDNS